MLTRINQWHLKLYQFKFKYPRHIQVFGSKNLSPWRISPRPQQVSYQQFANQVYLNLIQVTTYSCSTVPASESGCLAEGCPCRTWLCCIKLSDHARHKNQAVCPPSQPGLSLRCLLCVSMCTVCRPWIIQLSSVS